MYIYHRKYLVPQSQKTSLHLYENVDKFQQFFEAIDFNIVTSVSIVTPAGSVPVI